MLLNGSGFILQRKLKRLSSKHAGQSSNGPSSIQVNSEILGIGAPAWLIKEAAELLGEEGNIPPNAEVAGAVGMQ